MIPTGIAPLSAANDNVVRELLFLLLEKFRPDYAKKKLNPTKSQIETVAHTIASHSTLHYRYFCLCFIVAHIVQLYQKRRREFAQFQTFVCLCVCNSLHNPSKIATNLSRLEKVRVKFSLHQPKITSTPSAPEINLPKLLWNSHKREQKKNFQNECRKSSSKIKSSIKM